MEHRSIYTLKCFEWQRPRAKDFASISLIIDAGHTKHETLPLLKTCLPHPPMEWVKSLFFSWHQSITSCSLPFLSHLTIFFFHFDTVLTLDILKAFICGKACGLILLLLPTCCENPMMAFHFCTWCHTYPWITPLNTRGPSAGGHLPCRFLNLENIT